MATITPDIEQIILAAIVVSTMLFGMRYFYGAWPWEHHKTWYATRRLLPTVEQDEQLLTNIEEVKAHNAEEAELVVAAMRGGKDEP